MQLARDRRDWEDLGKLDPFWAVLTDSGKNNTWDLDEFFRTGERDIAALMERAGQLGHPAERKAALDFGCGVGRLTQALAGYFEQCTGVDIAQSMVAKARELGKRPNCTFVVNTADNLRVFPDRQFDLVCTFIVLQHIGSRAAIKSYIAEFVRVLKPEGLLVFQLPSHVPLIRGRSQLRRRAYETLRRLGFREKFLYERLNLVPMRMNFVPEKQVRAVLAAQGARVLDVQGEPLERTYYVTRLA
jgi:ubiquinone/menaquinone biosynthesis C-methylase UbiE